MGKVLIIAEAGVNHNGSLELAKRLVDVAKESGADIVKFQTANLRALVSKSAPMAEYQKQNTGKEEAQFTMLEKLLLTYREFRELADYCKAKEIQFLSTPFDIDSVRFLEDLVELWKIPSGEITNLPYLIEIAKTGKKVILSTGMSTIAEVRDAVEILRKFGTKELILLHCTTQYPAPYEEVNLKAMLTLKNTFDVPVGYSDHTRGTEVAVAAAAMGAAVIEKHFTLSRAMEGPDHKASLEPDELKELVREIRNIEKAMGDGRKEPSVSEMANMEVARKSIVTSKPIRAGESFTEDNLTTKRPGSGISPMKWFEVVGQIAMRDYAEDELVDRESTGGDHT